MKIIDKSYSRILTRSANLITSQISKINNSSDQNTLRDKR